MVQENQNRWLQVETKYKIQHNFKYLHNLIFFSEGSVLVDYLIELNNISKQVDTRELKTLFHSALEDAFTKTNREPKASDLSKQHDMEGKLTLGNFVVDPKYTDFVGKYKNSLDVNYQKINKSLINFI